jgi:hypothetical protein
MHNSRPVIFLKIAGRLFFYAVLRETLENDTSSGILLVEANILTHAGHNTNRTGKEPQNHMGELSGIDILILALVAVLAVLAIYLRIRLRRKAKSGCGGCCGSCSMYCGKNPNGDKEA